MSLVSICIPAYNTESMVAETLSIAREYVNHGVRCVYHSEGSQGWVARMPKYIGGFANWNYILSQGHGDYLRLFRSDDLYEPSIAW